MYINELVWIPEIVMKLVTKHNITPEEIEAVFLSRPHFRFHEKGRVESEHMYTALGQTEAGRYLIVFFIMKSDHKALIISARDMDISERKRYGKK
jgi:uncharacterized DUF497 family protein